MNKVKDSYEDGICPDCNENIPDNVVEGDSCKNCGHVFYKEIQLEGYGENWIDPGDA